MARSLLDGISVWAREVIRPESEQFPGIIEHERRRADRLADYFESIIGEPPLTGKLNTVQIALFCALDADRRLPDLDWRAGRPDLVEWHARMLAAPSVKGSIPPSGV